MSEYEHKIGVQGCDVSLFKAEDGKIVVQIETCADGQELRVWLNEGLLYEGDPEKE